MHKLLTRYRCPQSFPQNLLADRRTIHKHQLKYQQLALSPIPNNRMLLQNYDAYHKSF